VAESSENSLGQLADLHALSNHAVNQLARPDCAHTEQKYRRNWYLGFVSLMGFQEMFAELH
jgi:hypothetical protein